MLTNFPIDSNKKPSKSFHLYKKRVIFLSLNAEVAKLADALALGASGVNPMEVQVLSSAQINLVRDFYVPKKQANNLACVRT